MSQSFMFGSFPATRRGGVAIQRGLLSRLKQVPQLACGCDEKRLAGSNLSRPTSGKPRRVVAQTLATIQR
jgi:hypothetical protein